MRGGGGLSGAIARCGFEPIEARVDRRVKEAWVSVAQHDDGLEHHIWIGDGEDLQTNKQKIEHKTLE